MHLTNGAVFATTASLAGSAAIAFDLAWAALLAAIVVAMFCTVFRLVRTVAEGPARPRRELLRIGRPAPTVLDLR